MRIRSATALGLVAVAAASCGGGGGSSDPVTGVRQTLHQFASDVASGDYAGEHWLASFAVYLLSVPVE